MIATHPNALLRALSICAKYLRKNKATPVRAGGTLPPLTPHIARDIGLTPSQRAVLEHRWPSQTTQHPYL